MRAENRSVRRSDSQVQVRRESDGTQVSVGVRPQVRCKLSCVKPTSRMREDDRLRADTNPGPKEEGDKIFIDGLICLVSLAVRLLGRFNTV
jgi:hypothetical protein